ncbi:MBL fold metallo-hydrolase [Amycolatopsis sp. CA-230715]|uniref:MBL fold metallo-hydrolase n=1 Tax=Amycolatopsis sp. CA-230715 TaxID=2745196 RepID=UPI001C02F206|nr:MBL fold metallo-hydrolase [Amycolatopsis sp. CA-230715]QWF82724.1 Hydroxyacylglutathione hydrolase [Amycolatopsis sp. CA-230715]
MDVIEISERLHLLRFPIGQAYLWRDDDAMTLVDSGPPGSAPAIIEALDAIGPLARIMLTHFHGDHTGSAAALRAATGAEVIAHRAEAALIRGEVPAPFPDLLDWERPLWEQIGEPELLTGPPTHVDREVADGEILDFGGGAQALSVPGHTDGSLALHLPAHGVLFTGDAIANTESGPIVGVFNTDHEQAAKSYHRMAALDVGIACFGHGDPLRTKAGSTLRAAAP